MSSSVLVVVIVAVIVAVATGLALSDPEHAATPRPEPERDRPPDGAWRPGPSPDPDGPPAPDERVPAFPRAAGRPPQHLPAEPAEPVGPSWAARLRAAAYLAVTVVVLGSLAAGAIGALLYVSVRALDRAVG